MRTLIMILASVSLLPNSLWAGSAQTFDQLYEPMPSWDDSSARTFAEIGAIPVEGALSGVTISGSNIGAQRAKEAAWEKVLPEEVKSLRVARDRYREAAEKFDRVSGPYLAAKEEYERARDGFTSHSPGVPIQNPNLHGSIQWIGGGEVEHKANPKLAERIKVDMDRELAKIRPRYDAFLKTRRELKIAETTLKTAQDAVLGGTRSVAASELHELQGALKKIQAFNVAAQVLGGYMGVEALYRFAVLAQGNYPGVFPIPKGAVYLGSKGFDLLQEYSETTEGKAMAEALRNARMAR